MEIIKITKKNLPKYEKEIVCFFSDSYFGNFSINKSASLEIAKLKFNQLNGYLEKESTFLIGVIEDDVLVGVVWVYIYEHLEQRRLHVNQIIVSEKHRSRGIGKKLIHEVEKIAQSHSIGIIDLNVSKSNQTALALYEKLGFHSERILMKKSIGEQK